MYIILYADDTVILAESPTELQMSLDVMQSYCKYILNVNKNTTSSKVYGELGRYPLNIECTSRCILFWARIISGSVSKLSVKMYNLLYKMYNVGIYNSPWPCFVKSTLLSAGFGYVWRDQRIPRTLE